jgi:hypothetical protein
MVISFGANAAGTNRQATYEGIVGDVKESRAGRELSSRPA